MKLKLTEPPKPVEYISEDPSPLLAAVIAWYEGLDDEQKRQVNKVVDRINEIMRDRRDGRKIPFGTLASLELLGAYIALDQGWLNRKLRGLQR